MSLTIDLNECEPHELEEFVSNPRISTQDLQFYADQLSKLIEQQKIADKQAISATPRTRTRHRATPKSEASDHFEAISVPSPTASRPGRRSRGRKQTNTRRKSARKMDEDSEEEIDYDVSKPNSVEYEWMSGINDDKSESSSHEDPLLNLDLTNLDDEDYELLLGDPSNHKKSKKSKKKRKKRHKKHKKKKKKRKKRGKTEEEDDDYIVSTDDEVHDWGSKEYEQRILQWTGHQLEKEAKSLERQICDEKNRLKHDKKEKETERQREQESEEENLHNLTIEEIQEKFRNKLADIRGSKHGEDPSKLYCICREPYDGTTQMICCDYCQEWYHLSCIGLSADKLAAVEKLKFKCPVCNGANPHDITGRTANSKGATFDSPKATPNPPTLTGNVAHLERQNAKYKQLIAELQRRLVQNRASMKKQSKEMTERLSNAKKDIDQERRLRIAVEKHMKGAKEKSDSMVKELGESFQHQKQKESELVNKLKKLEANKKKYKDSASDSKKKMKALKEEHDSRINEYENDIIPSLSEKRKQHEKQSRELEAKVAALQQQQISQQQQAQQSINSTYAQYQKAQQQLTAKSVEATKTQNLNSQLQHKMDALHLQATRNHQQWESIAKMKEDKLSSVEKQIVALQQQNNALRSNSNMPQVIVNPNAGNAAGSTPRPPSPIKMPATPAFLKFNDLELEELKMCRELCQKLLEANLFQVEHMARRASLTRDLFISWVSGCGQTPTVINDLNQATIGALPQLDPHQHLSMNCIRLLLIEIRKQLEAIASDTQTHDSDTISKVKSLLCEFQTASQSYELKMNEFKHRTHTRLLEGCRSQGSVLEMFCVVGSNENNEPKSEWVKVNVCNFDAQNSRVLVRKSTDSSMAYAAIDSATLRLPEHRNVVGNNGNSNGVITLPSMMNSSASSPGVVGNAHSNGNANASSHASGSNSNSLPVIARNPPTSHASNMNLQQPSYWNNNLMNPQRATPTAIGGMGMMTMGGMGMGGMASGRMNFNGIPSIPTFHGAGNVLPPFSDLQANSNVSVSNISSQHHISNNNTMAINTNNNISVINGGAHSEPIVIDEDDAVSKGAKSSSRKRKRSEEHSKHRSHKKKKKKHKHSDSDTSSSSDSDSDLSTDSDTESETESKKHKKSKKSHRKSKKHKKHKHKHKKYKKKKKNIKEEPTKKRKRGRPPKRNGEEDNRSVSLSSTASSRKRRGTKRPLPSSSAVKPNGGNPHKKRKMNETAYGRPQPALYGNAKHSMGNGGDYDVIDGGGDSDKNDSVCRICKHPGDLVCCEGCPSAYHADCIRPRVKQSWLDSFEDWYCPSCAPRFTYIPLKQEGGSEKWPMYKEPLLKELKDFMQKHPLLERDYCPLFHPSRKK